MDEMGWNFNTTYGIFPSIDTFIFGTIGKAMAAL